MKNPYYFLIAITVMSILASKLLKRWAYHRSHTDWFKLYSEPGDPTEQDVGDLRRGTTANLDP